MNNVMAKTKMDVHDCLTPSVGRRQSWPTFSSVRSFVLICECL